MTGAARIVGVLRETAPREARVAITPEVARKLGSAGYPVWVEAGAGEAAGFPDHDYVAAGASLTERSMVLAQADLLAAVKPPPVEDVVKLKPGSRVLGLLDPARNADLIEALTARRLVGHALERLPRTTRAQVMDALSSQANLAGYRAVVEAVNAYGRTIPMMTTPAGTIAPARVFVMGAGVAGLQAIATARRLGAAVTATDVRPAAKEQVMSLGAKFVAVEDEEFRAAEAAGGYAKAMSAEYQEKQAALVSEHLKKQDIVITTALIPGRPAPRLVSAAQVASMRAGSVVVDLAAEQGGNVEGGEPGSEILTTGGVKLIAFDNLASRVAYDASTVYARNLQAFALHLFQHLDAGKGEAEDEILAATAIGLEAPASAPLTAA
jgi:NAD(P) transhydrogenase subunit alpha